MIRQILRIFDLKFRSKYKKLDLRHFIYIFLPLAVLFTLSTGCANVPKSAITVNQQVSKGIETLKQNGNTMINAWEETGYRVINEQWDKIYEKAEIIYREENSIVSDIALNEGEQKKDVAGIATLIRDELRSKVKVKADEMRKIVSSNASTTLKANESITNLLISVNEVGESREAVLQSVGELLPIPPDVKEFVNKALEQGGFTS